MTIEYIFVRNYRAINEQGFNFSSRFNIHYSNKEKKLEISEKNFYIESFYGTSIKSVTGLVGQNGVGKSTILNYIKEVLSFPVNSNPDNLECIIVFYDWQKDEFIVAQNAIESEVNAKGYKYHQRNINSALLLKNLDDRYKTILGEIEGFEDTAILYLSNIYDYTAERDYGPRRNPYVVNLSLNYLLKGRELGEEPSVLKFREIENSIKFILNESNEDFGINLPNFITVNIKNIFIDDFLKERFDYKDESRESLYKQPVINLLKNRYFNKENLTKKERITLWLVTNLLRQIEEYYSDKGIDNLTKVLTGSGENLVEDLFKFLKKNVNFFSKEQKYNKGQLRDDFDWPEFFNNYFNFINKTIFILNQYDATNTNFNHIYIPLNPDTKKDIEELIILSEKSSLDINFFYYTWRDLSTGESMLLRFFSNLYLFSQHLRVNSNLNNYNHLIFLFDELEAFYHPQWQKRILKILIDFINDKFKAFTNQIVFTSHSPIVISDIPKSDLIFLQRKDSKIYSKSNLNEQKNTFAANIHTLLTDTFFLQHGHIGDFADQKINEIIDLLVDGKLSDIVTNKDKIECIINIVGEPIIKNKLLEILEYRLRSNLLTIKSDVDQLKARR